MKCLRLLLVLLAFSPELSSAQKKFELVNSGDVIKQCAALFDSGKYKQAIALNNINRSDTNYVWSLYEKAISSEADTQYTQALKYCTEALALKEQREWEPDILNTYGNVLMDLKQFDQARKVFDDGLAKYPSYSLLYFNKGITYMGEDKWAEAEACFQKSLLINPYMYSAHYQLGLAELNMGKIVPAYLSFIGYLVVNPEGRYWQSAIKLINQISRATDEVVALKNKRTAVPDGNYQAVEDILLSKMALDASYKSLSTVDDPIVKQIQACFEKLEYSDSNNDFWIQYYLPYYRQIFSAGSAKFDLFIYHIFSNVDVQAIQDYLKKNKKAMEGFENDAADYFNSIRATRELHFARRDTVKLRWAFDNGQLIGRGATANNGKLLVGYWQAFYHYGNLKAAGNYSAEGQRQGEWVYYHFNGQLKAKEHYVNGKLEGLQEYYFDNGNPSSKENYKDNQLDGLITTYYYTGSVKSTNYYKAGKKDGDAKDFYSNGNVEATATYSAGLVNGEVHNYYKSGQLKDISEFAMGKADGPYKAFRENGSVSAEGMLEKDKAQGVWKFYYGNGKLKETRNYVNDKEDGLHQQYFDSGQVSCSYNMKKGKEDGEQICYFKDGKLFSKYLYDNGVVKSGTYFDPAGNIKGTYTLGDTGISVVSFAFSGVRKEHFNYNKAGDLTGPDTSFYPSGKVREISYYEKGEENGPDVEFYNSGIKRSEINMADGKEDGYKTNYYANGKVESEGWVQAGDKAGEWFYYDELGRLTTTEYYLDGDLHGYREEFDAKGKKMTEGKYFRGWLENLTQYDDKGNILTVDSFPKFSGKYVLYYPNKQKMAEVDYVRGDWSGPYKGYYFDGSLKAAYFYKKGLRDSTYNTFFYGGKKDEEGHYVSGNRTGLWKYYDQEGWLSETARYVDDDLEGEKIFYFPDGGKDYIGQFKEGELNGYSQKYDPDGTLMYQVNFEDDRAQSYTYLGKDGKLVPAITIPFLNGALKAYYPSGKPSREVTYTDGEINGSDVLYYTNGQLRSVDTSKYGLTEGLSLEYYQNGKPKSAYRYKIDNADGMCRDYYPDGTLKKETPMDNGQENGQVKFYDKNGKLVKTLTYYYGKLISAKDE